MPRRLPCVNMAVIALGRNGLSSNRDCGDWSQAGFHQITLSQTPRTHSLAAAATDFFNFNIGWTISMPGCDIVLDDWRW